MSDRPVLALHPAERDDIGDLVTRRPVPGPAIAHLDPFLFLNHHGPQVFAPNNRGLPFGPHPHRGFETVTFILAGELAHRDSGGHESVIHAGGVQWMTAGRGLIHAELSPRAFMKEGGPLEILQLWVNLPARLKMTEPAYVGLEAEQIPAIPALDGDAIIYLVSGDYDDHTGPVRPLTDIALMLVHLHHGGEIRLPAPAGKAVFCYTVHGAVRVGGIRVPDHHLVELGDGDAVAVAAESDAILLFGHGTPCREPIVAHGPFVMNSREEIIAAINDYQAGRLGRL